MLQLFQMQHIFLVLFQWHMQEYLRIAGQLSSKSQSWRNKFSVSTNQQMIGTGDKARQSQKTVYGINVTSWGIWYVWEELQGMIVSHSQKFVMQHEFLLEKNYKEENFYKNHRFCSSTFTEESEINLKIKSPLKFYPYMLIRQGIYQPIHKEKQSSSGVFT